MVAAICRFDICIFHNSIVSHLCAAAAAAAAADDDDDDDDDDDEI